MKKSRTADGEQHGNGGGEIGSSVSGLTRQDVTSSLADLGDWVKQRMEAHVAVRAAILGPEATTGPFPSPSSPETIEAAGAAWPYIEAAAVLAVFDPQELVPVPSPGAPPPLPTGAAPNLLLAHSETVLDTENRLRWTLRDNARRAALQRLAERDALVLACSVTEAWVQQNNDTLQATLRACLRQQSVELEGMGLDRLSALLKVVGWLKDIVSPLPNEERVRQRLDLETLVQPLRAFIGHWTPEGTFVEHFRGRQSELGQLYDYVGILPPSSLRARVSRTIRAITNLLQEPPLLIHGMGGVGKSTLIAKFVIDHYRAAESDHFPWAYLDCDRQRLGTGHPLALLAETAWQLGIQYPFLQPELGALRDAWSDRLTASVDRSVTIEEYRWAVEQFAQSYAKLDAPARPLLLVFDTFEEVQYRSHDRVALLYGLMQALQEKIPRLRVVLAGRAPVLKSEILTREVLLKELDPQAALGYLRARGITDESLARSVVEIVGGHPLSLRLAVNLLEQPGGAEEITSLRKDRQFLFLNLRENLTREDVQGRLFQRILGHIHDLDVRKLVHPGLILRRITPALIRHVLAGPCGVSVPDDETARRLFDALRREVSLVAPATEVLPVALEETPDEALRFRPELRRQMLPLIAEDAPAQTEAVHRQAIAFYAAQEGVGARAEEIYHRLALGEARETIEARWQWECLLYLTPSAEELPPRARAYLAAKQGTDAALSEEEWQQADLEDWERRTVRRVRDLLNAGRAPEALELLQARTDRSSRSPLYRTEALVWERLGEDEKALVVAESGIEALRDAGNTAEMIDLLLLAGRLREAAGDYQEAISQVEQAQSLYALSTSDGLLRLQIEVTLLRLHQAQQRAFAGEDLGPVGDARRRVIETVTELLIDGMAQRRRRGRRTLLRETLCVLGGDVAETNAGLVKQILLLVGLPSLTPHRREGLAETLSLWDVLVSEAAKAPYGLLALSVGAGDPGRREPMDADGLSRLWHGWTEIQRGGTLARAVQTLLLAYDLAPQAARAFVEKVLAPDTADTVSSTDSRSVFAEDAASAVEAAEVDAEEYRATDSYETEA